MSVAATRNVLVTGATSPIGRATLQALRAFPGARTLLGVYGPGEPAPGDFVPEAHYVQADLTQYRSTHALLFGPNAADIDTIVHSPLHVDPLASNPSRAADNVRSTQLLLSLAKTHPRIDRIVFRSSSCVYRVDGSQPVLVDETHPLDLASDAPPGVRSWVEADLTACNQLADPALQVCVLRCAEILAPGCGSQLYDYLGSAVCLRALGYDPMFNLLSLEDVASAVALAVSSPERGVFNIPGYDSLPLTELIASTGRLGLPLPGPTLGVLYRARAALTRGHFDYALSRARFHTAAILDGAKARRALNYIPAHPLKLAALFHKDSRQGPA